ncbi:spermidine/putrescine ABC transporter substrate-binding protein PotF, partial [Pseudomonas syringae pv. tagetis]
AQCGVAFLDSAPAHMPIAMNYLDLPAHTEAPHHYKKAKALHDDVPPYVRKFSSAAYNGDLATLKICLAVRKTGDNTL